VAPGVSPVSSDDKLLALHLRSRLAAPGSNANLPSEKQVTWAPSMTAIIICDMWDRHWCKSAASRVIELAGPMNDMLKAARSRGILIIHAPSNCMAFYQNRPQRKRALNAPFSKAPIPLATSERWGTAWCWPDSTREGVLPIDDSDMGCDCATKCTIQSPWTRQIASIEMTDSDVVSDNGQEVWNVLEQHKIENVILCGVHLNMCVLGRPFAIRQMVKLGKNVALMRDMTDTMYNPERPPGVSHFDGTARVVEHIERYWCPSFMSTDLTGKPAFKFKDDRRP
jgi:nicotinamidase-related amidase